MSIYFLLYVLVWFDDNPLSAIFSFCIIGAYGALIPLIPYGVLFGILYLFGVISEESQLHHVLFSIYLALASIVLVYFNREALSEIGDINTSSVEETNTHQVKNSGFPRKEELSTSSKIVIKSADKPKVVTDPNKDIIEAERRTLERLQSRRNERWKEMSSSNLSEITKSNPDSEKRGLYLIHCKQDNKIYIGSSKNMHKRKLQHLNALRSNRHHSYLLQEAFNEFGEEQFTFYIIRLFNGDRIDETDEAIRERKIQKAIKHSEKFLMDIFYPEFNVESDTTGSRHWQDNPKYSRRY